VSHKHNRKRKREQKRELSPEEKQRHEREAEGWKQRAEEERLEGLRPNDGAGQWLTAKDAGRRSPLLGKGAPWRTKPATEQQRRILRERGLNPFLYPTRGAAADAISRR
jgi:hypothetical protein